jgi:hypothetical protein
VVDANQSWANFTKVAKERGIKTSFLSIVTPNTAGICDLKGLKLLDTIPKDKLLEDCLLF